MHTKLARMKYKGEPIDEYLSRWELICAQLNGMNTTLDKDLLITMFFESFGNRGTSDYGPVISALLTKDSLSWADVSARMMHEHESISNTRVINVPSSSQDHALRTQEISDA